MRAYAAAVSLALIGVVLWPLLRDPVDDGFPLSTYPMFATKRPTQQTFRYALGETAVGERRTLSPGLVGTGEVLQAIQVIDRAVVSGQGEIAKLCTVIAARVAADDDYRDVVAIRIVTGTHDAVEYLARDVVGRETQLERCTVTR
ncbi:MAG TPA: hypothetical protein VIV40_37435 [Kofleriaceae bacterium]